MINGVKALVDTPSPVRGDAIGRGHTRGDDENLPWWLILVPAALVTMIFIVTALAFLTGAPRPSESSVSGAEVQMDQMSETTPWETGFSR
jgi:hypothetical protein